MENRTTTIFKTKFFNTNFALGQNKQTQIDLTFQECFQVAHSDWKLDSMTSSYVEDDTPWDDVVVSMYRDDDDDDADTQTSLQLVVEISRNTKILEKLFYAPLIREYEQRYEYCAERYRYNFNFINFNHISQIGCGCSIKGNTKCGWKLWINRNRIITLRKQFWVGLNSWMFTTLRLNKCYLRNSGSTCYQTVLHSVNQIYLINKCLKP